MIFTQWSKRVDCAEIQRFFILLTLLHLNIWSDILIFMSNSEAIWPNLNFRKAAGHCCVAVVTELSFFLEMLLPDVYNCAVICS